MEGRVMHFPPLLWRDVKGEKRSKEGKEGGREGGREEGRKGGERKKGGWKGERMKG